MKTSRTMIAIAIAALIPMGAAVAGDKDKSSYGSASFDTLDTNHDGKISQGEASADSTIMFSTADTNGDGYISKSEWKNRAKTPNDTVPPQSPQSMPETTTPEATTPDTTSVPAVPRGDQPASEPTPDTESPRQ